MRDLVGYGPEEKNLFWPNKAKLAINFVINYEEGAELSPLYGDAHAETSGADYPFAPKAKGKRNLSMESFYEYGSRVGIWRLLRLFDPYNIPLTFFVTGQALVLNPVFADYLAQQNHEVAGHAWRWLNYTNIPKKVEKKHMLLCVETLEKLTGRKPKGWYTGRRSENTRELLLELGGFLYDSDSYADELPYYINNHLVIPYSLDCNDFRFTTSPGFQDPRDFYERLMNTFCYLYQEKRLAIMTIGLHPRLSGKPDRCFILKQFLDHLTQYQDIWITRRMDIAKFWLQTVPHGM
ncbi:polysaccharide deacetylase family protein [Fluoribacter dumoffii]|uniref:polysaccharide deacetylase family protein n=1 Tax=Fluoribacter dumoffii TaxID=463 RepID=UPI002242EA35|nr:polysaccharide deacetylase family protein [Fluoribacter dumoffii]MCW8418916.1 polysaccharide deacetylase family protein [Fluoribacter dumoffii]MCW8453240.1 polysaccharide deacetylase family protein [Fluoribacter dumoffii]MCW8459539.1 polysaccharide deacetylase family protein [Fluoribacter dumoffii]MCW8482899.1 polysaccharide deacetylase family protein [Fluoribacter dumoffii]